MREVTMKTAEATNESEKTQILIYHWF